MGAERRWCERCQKAWWWPGQLWMHKDCEVAQDKVSEAPVVKKVVSGKKQRWSREAYNAYQREYMRKWRAK